MKIKSASASLSVSEDFTQSVNEMLKDGALETFQEIEEYIKECLREDVILDIQWYNIETKVEEED